MHVTAPCLLYANVFEYFLWRLKAWCTWLHHACTMQMYSSIFVKTEGMVHVTAPCLHHANVFEYFCEDWRHDACDCTMPAPCKCIRVFLWRLKAWCTWFHHACSMQMYSSIFVKTEGMMHVTAPCLHHANVFEYFCEDWNMMHVISPCLHHANVFEYLFWRLKAWCTWSHHACSMQIYSSIFVKTEGIIHVIAPCLLFANVFESFCEGWGHDARDCTMSLQMC